jgi:hypothetical protein
MARRIAHAEWTGELTKGRGEASIGGKRLLDRCVKHLIE